MQRREFLAQSSALGVGSMAAGAAALAQQAGAQESSSKPKHKFQLKYAPEFRHFRNLAGNDVVDMLKFGADQGFTAWEDNGMKGRSIEEQERIAKTMDELGMEMGVFVACFARGTVFAGMKNKSEYKDAKEDVLNQLRDSVEVAKRVNAKWMTVVPGNYRTDQEWGYQTANAIDMLRECAAIFEPHELVMVLEPLNWWTNHAGLFLAKIPQAYEICRAVDSPACKILFDIYHQQIQEGNLIPNIDLAWDEIGYFQVGDNPGRNEPGTGEINYRNVFKHIHAKGWEGIVGMEHGNSKPGAAGEQAVIDAYVAADDF